MARSTAFTNSTGLEDEGVIVIESSENDGQFVMELKCFEEGNTGTAREETEDMSAGLVVISSNGSDDREEERELDETEDMDDTFEVVHDMVEVIDPLPEVSLEDWGITETNEVELSQDERDQ